MCVCVYVPSLARAADVLASANLFQGTVLTRTASLTWIRYLVLTRFEQKQDRQPQVKLQCAA